MHHICALSHFIVASLLSITMRQHFRRFIWTLALSLSPSCPAAKPDIKYRWKNECRSEFLNVCMFFMIVRMYVCVSVSIECIPHVATYSYNSNWPKSSIRFVGGKLQLITACRSCQRDCTPHTHRHTHKHMLCAIIVIKIEYRANSWLYLKATKQ